LHGLIVGFRTINPAVVFFVTFFTIHTLLAHCFFSFLKKINKPIHPQAKKKSGTPTATTVPEMYQKKKQLKAIIHKM